MEDNKDDKAAANKEILLNYLRSHGMEDMIIERNLDGVDINTQLDRLHRRAIEEIFSKQLAEKQAQAVAKRITQILNGK